MKPTFGHVFAFSFVGLIVILALLFHLVSVSSRDTIAESSERLRDEAARAIGDRLTHFLDEAPETVHQFQRQLEEGLVDARDPQAVERALFSLVLANGDLSELTLTYADAQGFDAEGYVTLAAEPRGQWTVLRTHGANREEHLWSRHLYQEKGAFVASTPPMLPRSAQGRRLFFPAPTLRSLRHPGSSARIAVVRFSLASALSRLI